VLAVYCLTNFNSYQFSRSRTSINPGGKEFAMAKNQPVVKFRLGYVTATVWQNGEHYSTVLSKSYKDGDE
jgi:hypothetical protein